MEACSTDYFASLQIEDAVGEVLAVRKRGSVIVEVALRFRNRSGLIHCPRHPGPQMFDAHIDSFPKERDVFRTAIIKVEPFGLDRIRRDSR